MIPEFDISGNLPPGIHPATWAEVEARFGVDAASEAPSGGDERGPPVIEKSLAVGRCLSTAAL